MIDALLESIHEDYVTYTPAEWVEDTVTPKDINDIREEANRENDWDVDRLRQRLWQQWLTKDATLKAYKCEYGRVIVLSKGHVLPSPLWIRVFRLCNDTKEVRVLWFASPVRRLPPSVGQPIEPTHVNGGYTKRCDAKSVVIYREEEAIRVLIHEMLHASCSDPYERDVAALEADTEAWAEVMLCALIAQGNRRKFFTLWDVQAAYAATQAAAAEKFYRVRTPKEYGWRYLNGRIDRFKAYGLPVPPLPTNPKPLKSLRLTPEFLSH